MKAYRIISISVCLLIFIHITSCKKTPASTPTPVAPVPSCSDGIKNQDEVEIDCGGSSCTPCQIKYPRTGTYGRNVLFNSDTLFLQGTDSTYSFRATVLTGSTLKIEVNRISGALYYYGDNLGWSVSLYNNGIQTYEILNPGTSELHFEIHPEAMGSTDYSGVTLLKFYENSNVETRRKVIVWH